MSCSRESLIELGCAGGAGAGGRLQETDACGSLESGFVGKPTWAQA